MNRIVHLIAVWVVLGNLPFGHVRGENYLTAHVSTFGCVADLIQHGNPKSKVNGFTQTVHVQGYYAPGDGVEMTLIATNTVTGTNRGTLLYSGVTGISWLRVDKGPMTVKHFGARGDGSTDDTACFNDGLNPAYNPGRKLGLPSGTFRVTSNLLIPANFNMGGLGGASVILCDGDFRPLLVSNVNNVVIHDMAVVCTNGTFNQAGLRFYLSTNSVAENISVTSAGLNGSEVANCRNVQIRNCQFLGPNVFGMFFFDSSWCGDYNCYLYRPKNFSHEFKSTKYCVSDGLFLDGADGNLGVYIWTGFGDYQPGDYLSEYNTIKNVTAIGLSDSQHLIHINASSHNTVENANVIQGGLGAWTPVAISGSGWYNEGLPMTGNAVSGSVQVTNVTNIGQLAVGNCVGVNMQTPIYTITNITGTTIYISPAYAGASSNNVYIGFVSFPDDNRLINVNVKATSAALTQGISIAGQTNFPVRGTTIENANVWNAGDSAIRIENATGVRVSNSHITNCAPEGIYLVNARAKCEANTIEGGTDGFRVDGASILDAIDNDVFDAGSVGVTTTSTNSIVHWTGGVITNSMNFALLLQSSSSVNGANIAGTRARLTPGSFNGQISVVGSNNIISGCVFEGGLGVPSLDSHIHETAAATANRYSANAYNPIMANNVIFGGTTSMNLDPVQVTATLDFPSTAANTSSELTVSLSGAAVGNPVIVIPPAAADANSMFSARVSSTSTITVRFNNYSTGAIDPASASYRLLVWRF